VQVLLISSSPHQEKSSTFLLAKEVLAGLNEAGVSSEILHLDNYSVLFCKHCEACHKKILKCSLKDDVNMILQKMLKADAIILATPNYINQVTASMKALFDRSANFIHCKRLDGKYIAAVVSSGSGHDQDVLNYLKFYALTCGAQYSGGVSAQQQFGQDKKTEAFELGKKILSDLKERKLYPDQLRDIQNGRQYFARIIQARKDDWHDEYEYWLQKGWLVREA